MRILLLTICLLGSSSYAEDRPIYWQYPGPYAERLEAAFSNVKTERDARHLVSDGDRRQFLKIQVKKPLRQNCLEDKGRCASEALGVLETLGFGGRISATAKRLAKGYEVTLIFESIKHHSVRTVTATSRDSLNKAAASALDQLYGQGTLSLALTPKEAFFSLNGEPYGQGSGDHLLTAGSHELKVEAPGFKSESMRIDIKTGERIRVSVQLVEGGAMLSLQTTPPDARVYLDGDLWNTPEKERSVQPGKTVLRVEKESFRTFEQTLDLKPSSVVSLKLKLVPSDPPWRVALKSKVADTTAMPAFFRVRLGVLSVRDRPHELSTNLSLLESVDEPMAGQNFGMVLSTRKGSMLVDLLRLDYTAASGPARGTMRNFGDVEISDLNRLTIAPLWFGYQHEIWRIVPYAMGGVSIATESINGRKGDSRFSGNNTEFRLGAEVGIRYVFNPHFFAGVAHQIEGFPGAGAHLGLGIHVGYAFEMPQKLKDFLQ